MDIFKAAPELLAEYMNFLLAFSRKPGETLESRTKAAETSDPAVSGKLVLFSMLSVVAAIVIVQIGAAIGMAEDRSPITKIAGEFDDWLLPFAVLVSIMALSAIAHFVLKAVAFLARFLGHDSFRGSAEGSVNAALGFAAWSIPLMTAAIVSLRIAAAHQLTPNSMIALLVGLTIGVAFWVYFIAAFAAAHRITTGQAGSLFGLTVALIVLLSRLF